MVSVYTKKDSKHKTLERLILRSYAHGESLLEAKKSLEIPKSIDYRILNNLNDKYETKNFDLLVIRAFKNNDLLIQDFTSKYCRNTALEHSKLYSQLPVEEIENTELYNKDKIKYFYNIYSSNIAFNYKLDINDFNAIEIEVINLKYLGLSMTEISAKLKLSQRVSNKIKPQLFFKFRTGNWFSLLYRALQLNIIKLDFNENTINTEIKNTVKNLITRDSLDYEDSKTKEYNTYIEFLKLYSRIPLENIKKLDTTLQSA